MKKFIMLISFVLLIGLLGACSEGQATEEKNVSNVSSTDKSEDTNAGTESGKEATDDNDSFQKELNKEIVDNENIKVTLLGVEKVVDKEWDEEKILVKFEVENKRDETIEVQAREVSADGKMISESMLFMSQEISSGKRADAVLTIQNYEGDLPIIEDDIEMILHIFSWDNFDYEEDHQVTIEFN